MSRTPSPSPQVGIVCAGRFVAFDIARALAERESLAGLVTAYPRALGEGVPWRSLHWNPWLGARELAERRWSRTSAPQLDYEGATRFGRWAASHLPRADVLQLWSGYALESLRACAGRDVHAVLMRGSSHIAAQRDLLVEEYSSLGFSIETADDRMVERELAEYDAAPTINVLSSFAKRTFVDRGIPAHRVVVTPLGVDVAAMTNAPRVPRNGPLRVLYLGSISARKGVHYLLEAVRSMGRDVTLSLIGGVSDEGEALLRRFGVPNAERGKATRGELPALFARHDVIVLPSVEDGFGAVICEGMAAGLPAIATTHSGGPDVIVQGETGFIVPPRSPQSLAAALSVLADDPARCVAMGWAAARAMRAAHTWDYFVDDMLNAYGRLGGQDARACA